MNYKGLFYLNIVLTVGVIAKDTRIIGGTNADAREFLYTVSFRDISVNTIYCSGAIISHRHILTSAQCATQHRENPEYTRIYTVLTLSTSLIGPSFRVEKNFIHPGSNRRMDELYMNINDISVFKVVETIEFNEFQNKIDLPTENIQESVDCILSGWGSLTHPEDTVPTFLQKTAMTIMNHRTCAEGVSFHLHHGNLCGNNGAGAVTSYGDSGGPLVCNNKLVGIASFSIPSTSGFPEFFANVYYFRNFINAAMRS